RGAHPGAAGNRPGGGDPPPGNALRAGEQDSLPPPTPRGPAPGEPAGTHAHPRHRPLDLPPPPLHHPNRGRAPRQDQPLSRYAPAHTVSGSGPASQTPRGSRPAWGGASDRAGRRRRDAAPGRNAGAAGARLPDNEPPDRRFGATAPLARPAD